MDAEGGLLPQAETDQQHLGQARLCKYNLLGRNNLLICVLEIRLGRVLAIRRDLAPG